MPNQSLDIKALIQSRLSEKYALYERYINPWMGPTLKKMGVDRTYLRGEGCYLYDDQGNQYLDCDAGSGQFVLGRNHAGICQVIRDLLDMSPPSLAKNDTPLLAGLLAEKLTELTPGNLERAIFTSAGSETVEVALKFARRATGRSKLIYLEGDFHGLSFGAISVTDGMDCEKKENSGIGPVVGNTIKLPRNNLEQLEAALQHQDVAGVIVEPIQGATVDPLDADYFRGAQELCNKYGTLLIADEIFVGLGRTGKMFACQHYGVEPDIMTLSKALSGGIMPVGCLMIKEKWHTTVYAHRGQKVHTSTFMGNDFSMAAGLATLHYLEQDGAVQNAAERGDQLIAGLKTLQEKYDMAADVRGMGLLVGVELRPPNRLLQKLSGTLLEKKGLLGHIIMMHLMSENRIITVPGREKNTLKIQPSLIMSQADVEHLLKGVEEALSAAYRFPDGISQILIERAMKNYGILSDG